jgi:prepilin-type N-terminal cleavage/methylation domain-containing protein
MTYIPSHRGFTLIETLIATTLLVTALAGLAELFALSIRSARESGRSAAALRAAQAKLESLRALAFGYDALGMSVTDARLAASPLTSLTTDTDRYVDWVDASGVVLPSHHGAALVRRWRITSIDADDPEAIAIDVCVYAMPAADRGPHQADACLATIRVRQP